MTEESYTTQGGDAHAHRAFVVRRLHSLSGVVPIGIFLIEHLWTNARALAGRAAFDQGVADIQRIPFLPAVEVLFILLPLAFHAFYGVVLALRGRPNVLRYAYSHNWLYLFQRITGFLALAFIVIHLWEFRVQKAFFGMRSQAFYDTLAEHLSSTVGGIPLSAIIYLVGLGSVVFHFANGLSGFAATWGIAITRNAQRRVGILAASLGVGLFLLGTLTVMSFATGAHFGMGTPSVAAASLGPCPPASP